MALIPALRSVRPRFKYWFKHFSAFFPWLGFSAGSSRVLSSWLAVSARAFLRLGPSRLASRLIHRLHTAVEESWPCWVWATIDGEPLDDVKQSTTLCGSHWNALLLLPLYRCISRVQLGDGRRTAFWLDSWLPSGPLAQAMPELFSHCTKQHASVRVVIDGGLAPILVPHLSAKADAQRRALASVLASTRLAHETDWRTLPLCGSPGGRLRTSSLYKLCTIGGEQPGWFEFVWRSHAPSRVRFFAWLLVQSRVQCRANLIRKGILTAAESDCPICSAPLETADHLFFECPFARRFWAAMGSPPSATCSVALAAHCPLPASAPPQSASTLRLLCLWHIWKHRNGVVFNNLAPSLALAQKNCRDDAVLWRARLPMDRRSDVDLWLAYLVHERP